jgi:hypothetical protein
MTMATWRGTGAEGFECKGRLGSDMAWTDIGAPLKRP